VVAVNDYGLQLFDHHARLLADSAISVEVARERGYRTAGARKELGSRGFSSGQQNVPGLLIPVHDETGAVALHQYRPDEPRVTKAGKAVKYETPAKTRMVVDVPPRVRPHLGDPSRPLWITEGIRKADAAVTVGLDCLALLGVWNWRGRNDYEASTALAFWESVALTDRRVYVCFDSDVMLKRSVPRCAGSARSWPGAARRSPTPTCRAATAARSDLTTTSPPGAPCPSWSARRGPSRSSHPLPNPDRSPIRHRRDRPGQRPRFGPVAQHCSARSARSSPGSWCFRPSTR